MEAFTTFIGPFMVGDFDQSCMVKEVSFDIADLILKVTSGSLQLEEVDDVQLLVANFELVIDSLREGKQ